MENIQNEVEEPKENLQEEQELLKETPADDVRNSIIEKYGLDNELDEELITKIQATEATSRKALSTAVKQKIGWRTKAQAGAEEKPVEIHGETGEMRDEIRKELEAREVESLEVSDETKEQIKSYAKANSLTVKQIMDSDFYKFLKNQEDSKQKVEEASIGGKRRAPSTTEFSSDGPPDVDMATEEGQKTWEAYKVFLKK